MRCAWWKHHACWHRLKQGERFGRPLRTCGPHAAHIHSSGAGAAREQERLGIRHCLGSVLQQQAALWVHRSRLCPCQAEAIGIEGCHAAGGSRAAVQRSRKASIGGKSARSGSALVWAVECVCTEQEAQYMASPAQLGGHAQE